MNAKESTNEKGRKEDGKNNNESIVIMKIRLIYTRSLKFGSTHKKSEVGDLKKKYLTSLWYLVLTCWW